MEDYVKDFDNGYLPSPIPSPASPLAYSSPDNYILISSDDEKSDEPPSSEVAGRRSLSTSPSNQSQPSFRPTIASTTSGVKSTRKRRRESSPTLENTRKLAKRAHEMKSHTKVLQHGIDDDSADEFDQDFFEELEEEIPEDILSEDEYDESADSILPYPFGENFSADQKSRKRARKLDDDVLKNRNLTGGTRLIRNLAGAHFGQEIVALEPEGSIYDPAIDKFTCDPEKLKQQFRCALRVGRRPSKIDFKGTQIWYDETSNQQGFGTAIVDGESYRPGDCVLISREDFDLSDIEPSIRFARIAYLYQDDRGKFAHVRCFEHGSQTMLGELAGPHALFLLTKCVDISLDNIRSKIIVDYVDGTEMAEGSLVESKFTEVNHFFYQFRYDPLSRKFSDAPSPIVQKGLSEKSCDCCDELNEQAKFDTVLPIVASDGSWKGVQWQGTNYYINDFVYSLPAVDRLSQIFQIIEININIKSSKQKKSKALSCSNSEVPFKEVKLLVRVLERADDLMEKYNLKSHKIKDNRQLLMTDEEVTILVKDLEGKCYVQHSSQIADLNEYKEETDNFWLNEKISFGGSRSENLILDTEENRTRFVQSRWIGLVQNRAAFNAKSLKQSSDTMLETRRYYRAKEDYLSQCELPHGEDFFGGVGGLALGLDQSGSVKTTHLLEFAPAAARTAAENMPSLVTFNEDITSYLKRLVESTAGLQSRNQVDIAGHLVHLLPEPGEIQFISAGFPCPGFSGANYNPLADDLRNTLFLALLSAVDIIRPAYVLLENVIGLLSHKLGAKQGKKKTEGGIPQGSLKFIIRALTLLGYQVEFAVLQAGLYSTPQCRRRLIFWAALQGYELPRFPQATTTFSGIRSKSWHQTRRSAPHRGSTFLETTSDLGRFDWVNPHNVMNPTQREKMESIERARTIKQQPVLRNKEYVGDNEQNYATPPQNELQRTLRKGVSRLTNHVTRRWFDSPSRSKRTGAISHALTEQICNISLEPGSNYRSLPQELMPWFLSHADSAAAKNNFDSVKGRFARLNEDEPFPIILTGTNPGCKGQRVIHPTEKRITSIREVARAQGFPDSFVWDLETTSTKHAYRMIGNAVPVPLAKEVGREFLKTLISQFERGSNMPLFRRRGFPNSLADKQDKDMKLEVKKSIQLGSSVETAIELNDD